MHECENCQRDMSGSDMTPAWADGDNPSAYAICRHCRHKNILWGFGGDDD